MGTEHDDEEELANRLRKVFGVLEPADRKPSPGGAPPNLDKVIRALHFFEGMSNVFTADQARAHLLRILYLDWTLAGLADMVDPRGKSFWKLEPMRRRPGSGGIMPTGLAWWIKRKYDERVRELKAKGSAAPHKRARGELAKVYGTSDEAMRLLIDRGGGKRKQKRRQKRSGRNTP